MVRARSLVVAGVVGFALWRACGSADPRPPSVGILHTAVLRDGFAVMEADGDRHVIDLDVDGNRRRRWAVPVVGEARVLGTRGGTAVAWHAGKKIKLAMVTGDGTLGDVSEWGRNATTMCEGAASNDQRFAVGWIESDGKLWFVHGPMTQAMSSVSPSDGQLPRADWCMVTSAGDYIALMFREGSKYYLNMCSKKECENLVARVPLDARHKLLDAACRRDGCLIAFRDQNAKTHLGFIGVSGKKQWVKALPEATATTEVSIAAIGTSAMAVGFVGAEGASVLRVSKNGSMERAWADPASTEVPSVAWAKDRLMIAIPEAGGIRHEVVQAPR